MIWKRKWVLNETALKACVLYMVFMFAGMARDWQTNTSDKVTESHRAIWKRLFRFLGVWLGAFFGMSTVVSCGQVQDHKPNDPQEPWDRVKWGVLASSCGDNRLNWQLSSLMKPWASINFTVRSRKLPRILSIVVSLSQAIRVTRCYCICYLLPSASKAPAVCPCSWWTSDELQMNLHLASSRMGQERGRIERAGGRVELHGPCWRIDGGLNLSRALGDFLYKAPSCPSCALTRVQKTIRHQFFY